MTIPLNAYITECSHCLEDTLRLWQTDPDGGYDQECENCGFNGYCNVCDLPIDDEFAETIEDPRFCSEGCTHNHFAQQAAEDLISARKEAR